MAIESPNQNPIIENPVDNPFTQVELDEKFSALSQLREKIIAKARELNGQISFLRRLSTFSQELNRKYNIGVTTGDKPTNHYLAFHVLGGSSHCRVDEIIQLDFPNEDSIETFLRAQAQEWGVVVE